MKPNKHNNPITQRGQSLVEVALFFPIFLVLLAGMVEVANIIVTQNKVTSATRASTRFAVNGGENEGMATVALNTVTQTLEVSDDVWDIWAIRGTLNGNGDAFLPNTWEFEHIYGISNTKRFDEVDQDVIQSEVLAQLQKGIPSSRHPAELGGLRIAATYAMHDIDSILGLNAMPQYAEITSVADLSVMRITGVEAENTNGCDGFPIAVHEGIRSVTAPGTGSNPYPDARDFDGPSNPKTYQSFIHHQDNVPLSQAKEGMVYRVQQGSGSGNFGWLAWNEGISANSNTLGDSLGWPGNAKDYRDHGDGGQVLPGQTHVVRGYVEPGDASDTELQIGDWVAGSTGSINSGPNRAIFEEHVGRGRTLRLMIWSEAAGTGVNGRYKITGFAIFRLHGYHLSQGGGDGSWILAEFIRWDTSCGQPSNFTAP